MSEGSRGPTYSTITHPANPSTDVPARLTSEPEFGPRSQENKSKVLGGKKLKIPLNKFVGAFCGA
jgi:hypothetical protein